MHARHSWLVAVAVVLTMAAPVSAQKSHPADVAPWPVGATAHVTAPDLVPMLGSESAVLGLRLAPVTAADRFMVPVQAQGSRRGSVAMMVVGGAALIVGSLIDGDTGTIIMAGGGTIGLIGLYRYLR